MTTAWVTLDELRDRVPVPEALTAETLTLAILQATSILEGLSDVRPEHTATVIPTGCPCGTLLTGPYQVGVSGSPFYWRVGEGEDLMVGDRTCRHELVLPDTPVLSVEQVQVDGEVLDPTLYELVEDNRLRRLSGTWASRLRSVQIDYTFGGNLDESAKLAVSKLAVELAKSVTPNSGQCELPSRVQTVTRQNLSFAMLDPQTFLEKGRTGIYVVDLFLASRAQPVLAPTSSVWSADDLSFEHLRGVAP